MSTSQPARRLPSDRVMHKLVADVKQSEPHPSEDAPSMEVLALCTEAGVTFDEFKRWCGENRIMKG